MFNNTLITGGSGLLGIGFAFLYPKSKILFSINSKKISVPGFKFIHINLSSKSELKKILISNKITTLVHCAAITNVDYCEENEDEANEINHLLPRNISILCEELGIKFIFISTDQLYDGKKDLYSEGDDCTPINVYGKTKALAEEAVLKYNPNSLIIRTNFYGWGTSYRRSFSDFVYNSLKNNIDIYLCDDIFYTPILREKLISYISALNDCNCNGVFNIASADTQSKYSFGCLLADSFNLNKKNIIRIKSKKLNFKAKRPSSMALSTDKIIKNIRIIPESTQEYIEQLHSQKLNGFKNKVGKL